MSRIHPSSSGSHDLQLCNDVVDAVLALPVPPSSPKHTTLTVWKRSSMSFQGTDGFTVYDRHGSLAFRVDNYSRNSWSCSSLAANGSGSKALILMDGSGTPLLTLKPQQIFCIQNQWNGYLYNEDNNGFPKSDKKIFMMRRPNSSMFVFGQTKAKETQCEAEVFFNHHSKEPESDGGGKKQQRQPDYRIEGSFWNRNCKIRSTTSGEVAAKILRKRTGTTAMTSSTIILSEEVFSLVVQPGFDPQIIMAFLIILDRICVKPVFTTPLTCS